MRVASFILLSLCALASAAVTPNNVQQVSSIQKSLSNSEYNLVLVVPEDFNEDDVVALFNSLSVQERSLVASQIQALLESFRDVVINGSGDIPVLDPFVIDHAGPFLFTATGVRASGNVRNFRVEGLQWYLVDRVTFNAIRLTLGLQLTLPWVIVTGSYDVQASIALLTHRAGGDFRVFLNRLQLNVDVRLGTNILGGGHLVLRDLAIKIDIHDTNIQITGMTGSSLINTFINSLLQTVTQEVIQNELANVSALLSEELFDIINEVLKQFTMDDLLGSK